MSPGPRSGERHVGGATPPNLGRDVLQACHDLAFVRADSGLPRPCEDTSSMSHSVQTQRVPGVHSALDADAVRAAIVAGPAFMIRYLAVFPQSPGAPRLPR
jgi:hypothetical protein